MDALRQVETEWRQTEFAIIGTWPQLAKVNIDSLTVGDYTIASSSEVKNLGFWLDNQLKMDKHINKICQAAFYHLYNIRKIRKSVLARIVPRL